MREFINIVESVLTESSVHSLESYFGNEANFNIKSQRHWRAEKDGEPENFDPDDEEDLGPALFPDGGQWFICTDWACYVRRILGKRAQLYGFHVDELEGNFPAGLSDAGFDGHDFAVVDGRFIVDGWLKNIEGLAGARCVFDMQNKNDAEIVRRFYGDPVNWEHMTENEAMIDRETPEMHTKAMRGVAPPPAGL